MPTYREDLHLGHKVPLVESDDILDHSIKEEKLADDSVSTRTLQDKCVTEPKLDNNSVSTRTIQEKAVKEPNLDNGSVSNRTIQNDAVESRNIKPGSIENKHLTNNSVTTPNIKDKNVTPAKLSDNVQQAIVAPLTNALDEKYQGITNQLDNKYNDITEELYSMIASLQVGGIALSGKFGDRTDIGIHQKALTKALGRLWQELGTITGKTYMDFTLTVHPTFIVKEGAGTVVVTADCSDAISDFDSIKFYVNGVLRAESHDISVYTQNLAIDTEGVSTIRAVGVIFGKTITKEMQVTKAIPFFMGSGHTYTDVMNPECQKELIGTLEGDYDVVVKNTDEHMFIIIPISHKDEFRRADMNGLGLKVEIPMQATTYDDFVVYKSLNTYKAGTYNIDIDINS